MLPNVVIMATSQSQYVNIWVAMKKLLLISLLSVLWFGYFSGCALDSSEFNNLTKEDLERMKLNLTVGFHPESTDAKRTSVEVAFTMPVSGGMFFTLPDKFMRKEKLYKRIINLRVESGSAKIVKTSRPNVIRIEANNDERIVFSYNILGFDPSYPMRKASFSAPIVEDDYFLFAGSQALVLPAIRDGIEIPLTYRWDLPSDYTGFTNYNLKENGDKILATYNSLSDSLFVAGKGLKQVTRTINGNTLDVVVKGNFVYVTDPQIADALERLLKTQRNEFDDHSSPYFLASFYGRGGACPSRAKMQGTAHVNSFRAAFYTGCEITPTAKILVSHELMHNWIGKKLHVKGEIANETKWFSEGFTDFFGRVMALKSGVITLAEYFDSLNSELLIPYYRSENRNQTLKYIAQNMYNRSQKANNDIDKMPYYRGEIMALSLNEEIYDKNPSYSLIDVLRDSLKKVKDIPYDGTEKSRVVLSVEELKTLSDKYAPGAFEMEYRKIVDGTIPVMTALKNCAAPRNSTNARVTLSTGHYMDVNIASGFYWFDVTVPLGVCRQLYK